MHTYSMHTCMHSGKDEWLFIGDRFVYIASSRGPRTTPLDPKQQRELHVAMATPGPGLILARSWTSTLSLFLPIELGS